MSLYDVSEPGNTRLRFDATVANAKTARASGAQGAEQVTPFIALGSGWSTNLSRGCKADVFCGFDFTWPYSTGKPVDCRRLRPALILATRRPGKRAYSTRAFGATGYSYDLGGLMHRSEVAAQPERFGEWSYARQAAFFPSVVNAQISPNFADHGLSLEQAARVQLDHFAAYVRGAAGL